MKKWLFFPGLIFGTITYLNAQERNVTTTNSDNEYITDLSDQLTLRVLASRKIIGYQVGRQGRSDEAEYSPNDATSIGLGFTYRFVGLNANFKLPFLNNDDEVYGNTKSLDLASYLYLRKFTVDLFVQVYKGHYLSDNDLIASRILDRPYALRADLQTQFYGVNGHYIFNHERFSYRAAFLQNEWQRRSAGSFLAGVNLHHTRVKADSAILPPEFFSNADNPTANFNKSGVFSIGVDGGYAHTFVWAEHWFATLALMAGAGANNTNFSSEDDDRNHSDFGLHLNGTLRVAAGYNSEKWFAGVHYVNFLNRNYAGLEGADLWQQTANGLYRLVIARRLNIARQ
jgi:hypothetical protein